MWDPCFEDNKIAFNHIYRIIQKRYHQSISMDLDQRMWVLSSKLQITGLSLIPHHIGYAKQFLTEVQVRNVSSSVKECCDRRRISVSRRGIARVSISRLDSPFRGLAPC
jgi:hypothetical protein